jgi:polar amino acid transport system substrate-binding protein
MRDSQLRRVAWIIVLCYALLTVLTESGANVAGQGLDPVWAAARQRGVLRVAVDFGYRPFSDLRDGQAVGFDIDLVEEIARRLELQIEYIPSNLDSIYDDLQTDKADIAASALPYAPEQGWRVSFSEFYFNAGQVLLVPESSPIMNQTQLDGQIIGAALGSEADSYARRLARANPSVRLRSNYDTAAEVIADLRRGTLNAALVENAAALTALNSAPGLALREALTFEPYALVFPKRAFELRQRVNQVLNDLQAEGFFAAKQQQWFKE